MDDDDHDRIIPDSGQLLGVIEDDRLRATVTTTGADTLVTLEGSIDDHAAPVLDDLLEAVERWHRGAQRWAERVDDQAVAADHADLGNQPGAVGPDEAHADDPASPRLWIDARRTESTTDGWHVLDRHRQRWLEERGPCITWPPTGVQGSKR